jgi:O-acetylhomoserine (thiol)-lyase
VTDDGAPEPESVRPPPGRDQWAFETRQVHAGTAPDPTTGARAVPIYQTTSFVFRDADHAAALFDLAEPGYLYTRVVNPTQDAFERRIASLEGGVGALAVASGQAASSYAVLNLADAGDHIVSSASLYGGTYNLFHHRLARLGIETTFLDDPDDLDAWRAAIRPTTKAFFGESIGNPRGDVLDIEGVSAVAHDAGIPLVVDSTLASPWLLRPLEWGADIVVHSATKFIGGHGTTIGGVIVDGGRFDWAASGRFPQFVEPDPSYHGLRYVERFGALAFLVRARVALLRDLGAAIAPQSAFNFLQGVETLSLRLDRHVANAQAVAEWLEARSDVRWVAYPGLASSRWHERARRLLPRGAGAVLAFGIEALERDGADGRRDRARAFVEALDLFSHLANVGDVRSLAIHPASTTHRQLDAVEQAASGVSPDLVRLSVGIEHIDDILGDLDRAFAATER